MAVNVPTPAEPIAGSLLAGKRWYDFFVDLWRRLNGKLDDGYAWSLADDTATSFALPNTSRFVPCLIYGAGVNVGAANPWGIWFARGSGTPAIRAELVGSGVSLVTATTGALTGTTGVDTEFTISVADDGKLYLENRSGSARSGRLVFLGN